MADYGARYADRAIADTAKELKSTYRKAQKELKEKLAGFEKRFEQTNRMKRRQLEEGKITDQQYRDWLTGQVFIRNQWRQSIREVSAVMHSCNSQAAKMINERRLDVFAENYNYMAFKGEGSTGISFGLYNSQAVARLIMDDPKILPEWKVDEEKDYEWNERKVNGIVRQGIIQGESIPEITDRLCRDLSAANENKMMLFARTAITGAQNAGRQQQMNDAADMGIEIHKQWLATLDTRTRDSHRKLDGQEVPYNEPFTSPLGEIEYPGDPDADDPADVYNCRCTMVSIYPKYEDRSKPSWRDTETVDGMSYQEWKENKKAEEKKTEAPKEASKETPKEAPKETKEEKTKEPEEKAREETPAEDEFVPATTIEEAEAFARTFIDTGMWASFGISYEGVSLETANAVNETLFRFFRQFKVDPLSGVVAPPGNTKLGKAIQGAHAAFSPMNRGLLLNRKSLKTPEEFRKRQAKEKELVTDYLKNPTKYTIRSDRAKKLLDASRKSGRSVVAEDITDAIHHELGHAMEKQLRKHPDYDRLMDRRKQYADGISGYATESENEYIAESFCAWRRGEKCVDPELIKAFESLKR